ncbi:MAG: glycosyltransferase family 2 protein [bacterium]
MFDNKPVSIIVPAFNEEANIGALLNNLLAAVKAAGLAFEVIVVDDGSIDRTAEIAGQAGVKVVKQDRNRGYGSALKAGISQAQFDIILIVDADGTYPVQKIPELAALIGDYDMAVGARVGNHVKIPLLRRPAKWLLNKYANFLVKEKIPDLNSGLRAFKKDVFEKFRGLMPEGYSFTTTITLAFLSNNCRVKYLPIDYYKRGGRSKIKPIRDTINFFSLVTRTSLYFNPLRVFMPIAFFSLAIGAILLGYDVFFQENITDKTILIIFWGMQFGLIGLLADVISRQRRF